MQNNWARGVGWGWGKLVKGAQALAITGPWNSPGKLGMKFESGWGWGRSACAWVWVFALCPLVHFLQPQTDVWSTSENSLINPCYKENGTMACTTCLEEIHLEACMHSFDLHCVLRKTHRRVIMPSWTGVEIQNLGLEIHFVSEIHFFFLSLSLLSLPLSFPLISFPPSLSLHCL